jgi:thymidylate synthase
VEEDGSDENTYNLSCHVYCRSSDTFLGLPFNIASYAVLVYLVAKKCSTSGKTYRPKELIVSTGDTHIYANHVTQAWTQITREPLPPPQLVISDAVLKKDWKDLTVDDFDVIAYLSHPAIAAEMAI